MSSTPPQESPRIVAIALDDKMVYAFFVLVDSLKRTRRQDFFLIVGFFSNRLNAKNYRLIKAFLERLGLSHELRELSPSPLFTERRHLTITTFSKFVISDQVSQPHVWIDLDTVAREGWDDIFEAVFQAPPGVSLVVAEKLESKHTRFEGFNAGVLGWTSEPRKNWEEPLAGLPEKRFSSEQYLFNNLYGESFTRTAVRFNFLSSWHERTKELAEASIVHYSGPVKPWHLARRHAAAWHRVNPSWRYWFEAEKTLHAEVRSTPLERPLAKLAQVAVFSGRLHTGKGALAGILLKLLAVMGPLGVPIVTWYRRRRDR